MTTTEFDPFDGLTLESAKAALAAEQAETRPCPDLMGYLRSCIGEFEAAVVAAR